MTPEEIQQEVIAEDKAAAAIPVSPPDEKADLQRRVLEYKAAQLGGSPDEPDSLKMLELLRRVREYKAARREIPAPPPPNAEGLWEHLVVGAQSSVPGLLGRGKLPDMRPDEEMSYGEELALMAGTVIPDLPVYTMGAIAGGAAGTALSGGNPAGAVIGGGMISFGLTEAWRAYLLEEITKGVTSKSLAQRITSTAWAAAKGAMVGGLTSLAGPGVKAAEPMLAKAVGQIAAPVITKLAIPAAELTTMVTASKALEGKLPTLRDFAVGGVMLTGFKGAAAMSHKLMDIYTRTGRSPADVYDDALKDSKLFQDLLDDGVILPESYQHLNQSPLMPKTRQMDIFDNFKKTTPEKYDEFIRRMKDPTVPEKERAPIYINQKKYQVNKEALQAFDAMSTTWRTEFEKAQGGKQSHHMTYLKALDYLNSLKKGKAEIRPDEAMDIAPEIIAYKALHSKAIDDFVQVVNQAYRKGRELSPAELSFMQGKISEAKTYGLEFQKRSSAVGRGLDIHKTITRPMENPLSKQQMQFLKQKGGKDIIEAYGKMFEDVKSPAWIQRILRQRSGLDMAIEYSIASALSGFSTQMANIGGGAALAGMRVPKEVLAAGWGFLLRTPPEQRAHVSDAVAMLTGLGFGAQAAVRNGFNFTKETVGKQGVVKGLWDVFKEMDRQGGGKMDLPPPAIPGALGHVFRAGLKGLGAVDAVARLSNSTATIFAEASRISTAKGNTPGTKAHLQGMQEVFDKQPLYLREQALKDASRYVLMENGPWIKGIDYLRRHIPILHFPLLILKSPMNGVKETFRMTPLAPFVRQWRDQYAKGGIHRDRALAEVTMGVFAALVLWPLVQDGVFSRNDRDKMKNKNLYLTGGPSTNRHQREADYLAGRGNYSLNTEEGAHSINRMQPIGTLVGMIADSGEVWQLMNEEEQTRVAEAIMWSFTEVIRNQTTMKPFVEFLNGIMEPWRAGTNWLENTVGLLVPSAAAEFARAIDPYQREINSVLDAVQARIPYARENLLPRVNDLGELMPAFEKPFYGAPTNFIPKVTDPLKLKLQELGMVVGQAPAKLSIGREAGETLYAKLEPEDQIIYQIMAGQQAATMMRQMLALPGFDSIPKWQQRSMFEIAKKDARTFAAEDFKRTAPREEVRRRFLKQMGQRENRSNTGDPGLLLGQPQ